MRLAVTSDIHIDLNGPAVLDALVERVRVVSPDVLLLGGDIATGATTWLSTLLALRPLVPHLLVIAGNHDVWSTAPAVERGIDAWTWLDKLLPALAVEAGATFLDAGPVRIGAYGFVGSVSWYDLTTREYTLDAPDDAYRIGQWGGLKWNDHTYAVWGDGAGGRMSCEAVATRLRERLVAQMRSMDAPKLVVATHLLAFTEQIHRRDHPGWRFVNAFMGSLPLGQAIRSDPRVVLATAGHTHLPSDVRIGRFRALVSPLGYQKEWRGATVAEAVARALTVVDLPG